MATNKRPEIRVRMLIMPYSSWIVMALRSWPSSPDVGTTSEMEEDSESVTSVAVVGWNG